MERREFQFSTSIACLLMVSAVMASPATQTAQSVVIGNVADTAFEVLHRFDSASDGANPVSLIQATDGDFYGTTARGGAQGRGTVFKMTPAGAFTVLHSFAGFDGSWPIGLAEGANGDFYGTTSNGGAFNYGTAFKMSPDGNVTVLHVFAGGQDGLGPWGKLTRATDGDFYGTTGYGGAFGYGTAFKITHDGIVTVLHAFSRGADGGTPNGDLVQASDGNFYGTTYIGGSSDQGTTFRMTPAGSVTGLHSFGVGADAAYPLTALIQAFDGGFYGTTWRGGVHGSGTIYRMTSVGDVTVLESLIGGYPSRLLQTIDGSFYWTTAVDDGGGYISKMSPGGAITIPHEFSGSPDGSGPCGELIQGTDGHIYGVTCYGGIGGADGNGTVFRLRASAENVSIVQNGDFAGGMSGWNTFATPDASYVESQVTGGVLEFNRLPAPPGTTNQAVVFQHTGIPLPAFAEIQAQFDLGNSSSVRKRISVLLLDSDFTDLRVCTFWIPPNSPLTTYRMRSHTTRNWNDAAIYFYAATAGSDGGFNRLDNVSLQVNSALPSDRTECEDPNAPTPPGGADGPDLVANGDFGAPLLAPWAVFGALTSQVADGVFEFVRPNSTTPAGVVLQPTGQPVGANEILTATFELGNSSAVRKRVTVLLHDDDFADLSACTFWLEPLLPLTPYSMRAFATKSWSNATISVYAATVGPDQWTRLDNVTWRKTPSADISGTDCIEGTPASPSQLPASRIRAVSHRLGAADEHAVDDLVRAFFVLASKRLPRSFPPLTVPRPESRSSK